MLVLFRRFKMPMDVLSPPPHSPRLKRPAFPNVSPRFAPIARKISLSGLMLLCSLLWLPCAYAGYYLVSYSGGQVTGISNGQPYQAYYTTNSSGYGGGWGIGWVVARVRMRSALVR